MKKLLALVGIAVGLIGVAYATTGFFGNRDIAQNDGCATEISLADVAGSGGYETISLPTGYKMINLIKVMPLSPGAAQTCTVRFWKSTTDSTGGIVTVFWATTVTGEPYYQYFPVRCRKVSVCGVDATDDFKVEAYCTRR